MPKARPVKEEIHLMANSAVGKSAIKEFIDQNKDKKISSLTPSERRGIETEEEI